MSYERLIYTSENGQIVLGTRERYWCNVSLDTAGLSELKSQMYTTKSMGQDGETCTGVSLDAKDIDISGTIFERDKTAAVSLRRNLQRIFSPKLPGTLIYEYEDQRWKVSCYPEFSPLISRKGLFYEFQIALTCPDPFWYDMEETVAMVAGWTAGLSFDLEIPETGMVLSYRQPSVIVNVHNTGDAVVGFTCRFSAIAPVQNPSIMNMRTREHITIGTEENPLQLFAGDTLTVSTGFGDKRVTLMQSGMAENAFRYLDMSSTFFQLTVGENLLRYSAAAGEDNLDVSVIHADRYASV